MKDLRKFVVLIRFFMLLHCSSLSVAPWGHCCLLACTDPTACSTVPLPSPSRNEEINVMCVCRGGGGGGGEARV